MSKHNRVSIDSPESNPTISSLVQEVVSLHNKRVTNKQPEISVLIPVYGSPELTLNCINSIVKSKNKTSFEILVIDDASPDSLTPSILRTLASTGVIRLIAHTSNLGFPSACNSGFDASGARDVVILNSDTEVFGDWLDRLSKAASTSNDIATVTPLTNDGEICSYPVWLEHNDLEPGQGCIIDRAAAIANGDEVIATPTAVGHCTFISRKALDLIGGFDADLFKKGYGEENYFSHLAEKAGLVNLIHTGIFVSHLGGASFGPTKVTRINEAMRTLERVAPEYISQIAPYIAADPLFASRSRIDQELLRAKLPNESRLLITHSVGGGTERAVQEETGVLAGNGILPLIGRVSPQDADRQSIIIRTAQKGIGWNLGRFKLPSASTDFEKFLKWANIKQVDIHHLIDFHDDFPLDLIESLSTACVDYTVKLHDYYLACPRITLTDFTGRYCGTPDSVACQSCLDKIGDYRGKKVDILKCWTHQLIL